MRRLRLPLLLLGLAAPAADAKPVTMDVTAAFDGAWLLAEVEVLEVEIGAWMAWGGKLGRVRVRVTTDPSRIFRGLPHLGETFDLTPCTGGPQKCTAHLRRWQESGRVLLAVDERQEILLAGEEQDEGYLVRGWCDHNACLLRSSDPDLGGDVLERQGSHLMPVARASLAGRYREERQRFCGRVARFLSGEAPAVGDADLRALIGELGAGSAGRRERAQDMLGTKAHLRVDALREAAETAADPEVRRRLGAILDRLKEFDEAERIARRLAGAPASARRYVTREGLLTLDGAAREAAQDYLTRLYLQD